MPKKLCFAAIPLLLSGCAWMSGLSGESNFSCKAPDGVTCQTVSGVYHNSMQNNLPSQLSATRSTEARQPPDTAETDSISPRFMKTPASGLPIRKPPKVVRIWIAPWEDEAGDFHDQSFMYTMVNPGKWLVETNKTSISNAFKPVFPLQRTTSKKDEQEGKPSDYKNLVKPGDYSNLNDQMPTATGK